jgi:hypothetical protein
MRFHNAFSVSKLAEASGKKHLILIPHSGAFSMAMDKANTSLKTAKMQFKIGRVNYS